MRLTEDEWLKKGQELFGDDRAQWQLHCPACHHDVSSAIAMKDFPEVKGRGWNPVTECIGRYTDKVDCDWAAYGLFAGPLFVVVGEREVPAFDFAGRPFTGKNAADQKGEENRV